jgi:hypothetical protein
LLTRTTQILSILIACIALIAVTIRLAIRLLKLSRFYTDDFLLIFAAVTFIGSVVMVNLLLPYNQTEVDVGAGLIPPPPDLVHILDYDVKFQDATVMLANGTIFGVKFSFLSFFQQVLAKTGKLRVYWWCVVVFTIPCAVICACTEFMVCPAFGENILAVCVYSGLQRQLAVLYVTIVLDIVSDVLLISIPVILLWNVRMNVRRKLGLGWLLCLSSFCIICAIIRAVGHNLVNGQNDVVWILFWSHMEACVALIACSMTAFRGLFNNKGSRGAKLSPFIQDKKSPLQTDTPSKGSEQTPQVEMPTMTKPEISGLRSMLMWDPFEDREDVAAEGNTAEGHSVADVEHTSFNEWPGISSNATRRVSSVLGAQYEGADKEQNWHEASTEALRHSKPSQSGAAT